MFLNRNSFIGVMLILSHISTKALCSHTDKNNSLDRLFSIFEKHDGRENQEQGDDTSKKFSDSENISELMNELNIEEDMDERPSPAYYILSSIDNTMKVVMIAMGTYLLVRKMSDTEISIPDDINNSSNVSTCENLNEEIPYKEEFETLLTSIENKLHDVEEMLFMIPRNMSDYVEIDEKLTYIEEFLASNYSYYFDGIKGAIAPLNDSLSDTQVAINENMNEFKRIIEAGSARLFSNSEEMISSFTNNATETTRSLANLIHYNMTQYTNGIFNNIADVRDAAGGCGESATENYVPCN